VEVVRRARERCGAAVAVGRLCFILGLSARAWRFATWLSAFGFGSLFTLYDCYTSDPLMYVLGPVLAGELLLGRIGAAGVIASVGVLAKEFAAAPLWMFWVVAVLERRWHLVARVALAATTATLVWLAVQTWLMAVFHYTSGDSTAIPLAFGGYLARWVSIVGPRSALGYVFVEYGALYLLFPLGLARSPPRLRLFALAAIPVAGVLLYVQQPDRAFWNFQFIVIPAAVLVLEELPDYLCWLFVAAFALANLSFGAQLPFVPAGRFMLALSLAIAALAVTKSLRTGSRSTSAESVPVAARPDV
jgi:hypothetical protein